MIDCYNSFVIFVTTILNNHQSKINATQFEDGLLKKMKINSNRQ